MTVWSYDSHYTLTSPFGMRFHPVYKTQKFHKGIDLVVRPSDGPLYAFVAGEVIHASDGKAGTGFGKMGNVVAIKDKYGYLHCYAHMSAIVVKVGAKVERGQMIGRQGSTGISTGPHLHYEIRKKIAPSFGWTEDESGVVEPTAYLVDYYRKENTPAKSSSVVVNGKVIKDSYTKNNVVYVPLRDLAESLGLTVDWDSRTGDITVK